MSEEEHQIPHVQLFVKVCTNLIFGLSLFKSANLFKQKSDPSWTTVTKARAPSANAGSWYYSSNRKPKS